MDRGERQVGTRARGAGRAPLVVLALTAALVLASCSSGTTQTGANPSSTGATGATGSTGSTGATGAPGATVASGSDATGGPATGPARPSAGCANATASAAVEPAADATIDVDGTTRTYRQFVPASATTGAPATLILDFHGLGGNRNQQALVSQWEARAAADHLVVLTPQGAGALPNWASTPADGNPDTAFIAALLDQTFAQRCIDTSRVYAGGISNGGLESSILSCKLADRIAAVGLVSGIVVPEPCRHETPKPAIVFWGLKDCVLPWAGGLGPCLMRTGSSVAEGTARAGGAIPPVEDAVRAWAERNGCAADDPATSTAGDQVERRVYAGCPADAPVELYVVSNGGHTWPGSKAAATRDQGPDSPRGITTMEIDATDLMWSFFQRFQLPA